MPSTATIKIDLRKITQNTEIIVQRCEGIDIVAVTKATCGSPEVARAMLAGGATSIGESRLQNIQRLRDAGITEPIWLLRAPTPGLADEAVRLADVSLVSELETVRALDRAARKAESRHGIMAMVELGDLREGMMPAELPVFLERVSKMEGIYVAGIGVSLTCFGAIEPDETNLGQLAELARQAEELVGKPLIVSGGNSSSLDMAFSGTMPQEINSLRVGESILLGVDTLHRQQIPGLFTDAITLMAPMIECRVKPSKPWGKPAQDAFGNVPEFEDRGEHRRAVLAIGRQDAPPEGLIPVDGRVQVLGASSDLLIVDVDLVTRKPMPGESIPFLPTYAGTLALFTSPYVNKEYV